LHSDVLHKRLRAAAGKKATLRFDEYQRIVLYDPDHGYYATRAQRAGRDGDFLTSPEVAPLFAECWARALEADAEALDCAEFHVVELGAGRGTLARDLWDALRWRPLGTRIRFHLVEASRVAREAHAATLAALPAGRWRSYADLADVPARLGCGAILANEFFDNLPVRRVMQTTSLQEIVVKVRPSSLREALEPADLDLSAYLEAQGVRLATGQSAEVCLEAPKVFAAALSRFDRAASWIIDYGDEASYLYDSERWPHGTLATHRGHTTGTDPYTAPGEQDVTAHVNFTPLFATAEAAGQRRRFWGTQSKFLLENGLPEILERRRTATTDEFERLRLTQRAKHLFHPEALGDAFRVLHTRTP
jgi:SAM-dependent MidA family methyltransferase